MCKDNGQCQCNPFYEGKLCGTFKGCPGNLDHQVCSVLLNVNRINKDNFSNDTQKSHKSENQSTGVESSTILNVDLDNDNFTSEEHHSPFEKDSTMQSYEQHQSQESSFGDESSFSDQQSKDIESQIDASEGKKHDHLAQRFPRTQQNASFDNTRFNNISNDDMGSLIRFNLKDNKSNRSKSVNDSFILMYPSY